MSAGGTAASDAARGGGTTRGSGEVGTATTVATAPTSVPVVPTTSHTQQTEARANAVASSDIVFANGQAFNGRGYRVCGVANQRGTLCGRIGTCPFHSDSGRTPKRRRTGSASAPASRVSPNTPNSAAAATSVKPEPLPNAAQNTQQNRESASAQGDKKLPECVRRMEAPPQKSRFKRSWTPEEHRLFLTSMRKHGKGKWKEIARDVKTRTANQCQSHAQKYFLRQAKSGAERKKKSIHDLTDIDMDTDPSSKLLAEEIKPDVPPAAEETCKITPGDTRQKEKSETQAIQISVRPAETDSHPGAENVAALASVAAAAPPVPLLTDACSAAQSRASISTSQVSAAIPHAAVATAGIGSRTGAAAPIEDDSGSDEGDGTSAQASDAVQNCADSVAQSGIAGLARAAEELSRSGNVNSVLAAGLAAAAAQMSAAGVSSTTALQDVAKTVSRPSASNGMATVPVMLPVSALNGLPLNQILSGNSGALSFLNQSLARAGYAPQAPAPPPPPRLRVTIHKNGSLGGGMALMLPATLPEFFEIARKKLAFEGTFSRVFTRSGGEITSLDEMCHDDTLWLSEGEGFASPT